MRYKSGLATQKTKRRPNVKSIFSRYGVGLNFKNSSNIYKAEKKLLLSNMKADIKKILNRKVNLKLISNKKRNSILSEIPSY